MYTPLKAGNSKAFNLHVCGFSTKNSIDGAVAPPVLLLGI